MNRLGLGLGCVNMLFRGMMGCSVDVLHQKGEFRSRSHVSHDIQRRSVTLREYVLRRWVYTIGSTQKSTAVGVSEGVVLATGKGGGGVIARVWCYQGGLLLPVDSLPSDNPHRNAPPALHSPFST